LDFAADFLAGAFGVVLAPTFLVAGVFFTAADLVLPTLGVVLVAAFAGVVFEGFAFEDFD